MERQTKFADELECDHRADDPEVQIGQGAPRLRRLTRMPLLPAIAGLCAIGVVAAAWSTSQISLNFAGSAPAQVQQPRINAEDASTRHGGNGRPGHPNRSGVVIAFRATARTVTGFGATATILNRGSRAVEGWTLWFHIPNAQVLSASNVTLIEAGSVAKFRNLDSAPTIEPGQSVRVVFTARGAIGRPSECRFNEEPCTLV